MENKNFIVETLKYIGGKIAFLIVAGAVTLVFLTAGLYVTLVARPKAQRLALESQIAASELAASAARESEIAASEAEESRQIEESIRASEAEEISANFTGAGVYVGETGSVMILYSNGFADYYHSTVGLNDLNVWSYHDGVVDVSILCLLSEVTAEFDASNPTDFNFVSDSAFWDNERFTLISTTPTSMTETELQALVDEYYPQ